MDYKISDDYALNPITWNGTEIIPGIAGVGSPGGYLNGAGLVSDFATWLLYTFPQQDDYSKELGTKYIRIIEITGNRSSELTDAGNGISHTDSGPHSYTIMDSAHGVDHKIGTVISIFNRNGSGDLTILNFENMRLAGSGTAGTRVLAANGVATAVRVAVGEWIISGVGLS